MIRYLVLAAVFICSATAINFASCPLYTAGNPGWIQSVQSTRSLPSISPRLPELGVTGTPPMAECGIIPMPLFHQTESEPERGQINLFLKKVPGSSSAATRHSLWLLSGGPGESPDYLEPGVHYLYSHLKDFDFYILDHRGVGRSQRMTCLLSQAETKGSKGGVEIVDDEVEACGKELRAKGLETYANAMTPDNAARDLARLINMTTTASTGKTFVYGVSYGTMWGQRFLYLYPDLAEGVILDGVVTLQGPAGVRFTLDRWTEHHNAIGLAFLHGYAQTEKGKARVTADPHQFIKKLYERMFGKDHWCLSNFPEGWPVHQKSYWQDKFGTLLASSQTRHHIPALLYRLNRCNQDDIAVLKYYLRDLAAPPVQKEWHGAGSSMLQTHIVTSELFDQQRAPADIEAVEQSVYIGGGTLPTSEAYHKWKHPTYPVNPLTFNQTLFAPNARLLLLNGDLDPQTPHWYARRTSALLKDRTKSVQYVEIPGAPHFALVTSPLRDPRAEGHGMCGMKMLVDFVTRDTGEVDGSCTSPERLAPVDYEGRAVMNNAIWGVEDVYEGVLPTEPEKEDEDGSVVKRSTYLATVIPLVVITSLVILFLSVRVSGLRKALASASFNLDYDRFDVGLLNRGRTVSKGAPVL